MNARHTTIFTIWATGYPAEGPSVRTIAGVAYTEWMITMSSRSLNPVLIDTQILPIVSPLTSVTVTENDRRSGRERRDRDGSGKPESKMLSIFSDHNLVPRRVTSERCVIPEPEYLGSLDFKRWPFRYCDDPSSNRS